MRHVPLDYPTPELRSDRVVLRRWSMDDLACVEAASRAGYSRGSTIPVEYSVDEARAWIERQWAKQEDGTGLSLAIAHKDTGTAIGMVYIGLKGIEGHGALGYWLVPEVHRQGFGTEAVTLACEWALRETDLYRLVAYVEPPNTASIALLRKCGFTEEGLLRSFLPFDDGVFDALSFSLLTSDLPHPV
jgi:RimJ/RimL family protein N-acetyltransferase